MEPVRIKRMSECTLNEALQAWNEGFQGYFVQVTMTLDGFLARMANEHLSPELSVLAFVDGKPAGIVLNGCRTIGGQRVAWNGGTAVAPAHRRRGIGRRLMEASLEIYREQQAALATLEAIADNEKAIRLYRQMGYAVVNRLAVLQRQGGGAGPAAQSPADVRFELCKPQEAARLDFYAPFAPWQTQWMSVRDGEAFIAREADGQAAAYAIFKRGFDAANAHTSTTLYQCAVRPDRQDRKELLHGLLSRVFAGGPGLLRRALNVPADHEAVSLLAADGFETVTAQVFMTRAL
jgi:ribosomal protein S18 acetylase RimI-like enzyme